MSKQSKIDWRPEHRESEDLENDWWIWGVIFTMLALAMMGLATLFSVSTG